MSAGASCDLGRVRDGKHLVPAGQFGETHADRIRHGTAHAGVDLVEHERGRRAAVGQRHLQGEQKRASSPPDATFINGPGRVRDWSAPKFRPVDAMRPAAA